MTAPNPMKDGAARTGDNAPADREHLVDSGPTPNRQIQELAQSDQILESDDSELSSAHSQVAALEIGPPAETDVPVSEGSGEPLSLLAGLSLEELMELKVLVEAHASYETPNLTSMSLEELMRTQVLSGEEAIAKTLWERLLALSMDDLMELRVIGQSQSDTQTSSTTSGGGSSFDVASSFDVPSSFDASLAAR